MNELIPSKLLANGGWGVLTAVIGTVVIKLIERYRSPAARRRDALGVSKEERDLYEARLSSLGSELDKWRSKVDALESRLDRMVSERHQFYDLLVRCSIEHPTASAWLAAEVAKLRATLGE